MKSNFEFILPQHSTVVNESFKTEFRLCTH